jgi:hypothetical protein
MKSLTSLFTIAALTLATSLFAQEETPSSTEEKASAAVEEAAPAMPTSTPEEKSSATITTSPDAQKKEVSATSASPAAAKKKAAAPEAAAAPAKASSKAAPAKASMGPDKGSAEANLKRLEQEWEDSIMHKDLSFAQGRVAEDFMGVSSKGKATSKSSVLKELKSDTDTYTSAKNGRINVRSYGPNVAVASGTSKEIGKGKDGKAFTKTYMWTDTWMLRGGRWQCIASQVMLTGQK